ncbi:Transcription regulator (plasmid) [Rhodovulum sp. P5]|nr:Transcription regulator [Rhodovulum sp. P5]
MIVNEKAGRTNAEQPRRDMLRERFASVGLSVDIHGPRAGQTLSDVARAALDDGADMLVAAGGDGTICAVAGVCHGADVPMGVIPQGTFNYFARGLGISQEVDGAIATLATGTLRDIRLGEVNGRVFLNNASIGLYPAILERRETIYRRWGRSRAAAYWSVIATLLWLKRALPLRLDIDGRQERLVTPLAFVANSAYQLDQFNLHGADHIRSGDFALFLSPNGAQVDLIRAAVGLAAGMARKDEEFLLRHGRDIVLSTGRSRVLVARDGEKEIMRDPLRFAFRDRPLRVVAPAEVS